jgi:hypothetical protein
MLYINSRGYVKIWRKYVPYIVEYDKIVFGENLLFIVSEFINYLYILPLIWMRKL